MGFMNKVRTYTAKYQHKPLRRCFRQSTTGVMLPRVFITFPSPELAAGKPTETSTQHGMGQACLYVLGPTTFVSQLLQRSLSFVYAQSQMFDLTAASSSHRGN